MFRQDAAGEWFDLAEGDSLEAASALKAQAEAALAKLAERGIRTAKVIQERPELPTQWLRLPASSTALQAKAKTLIPKISGKHLQPCG